MASEIEIVSGPRLIDVFEKRRLYLFYTFRTESPASMRSSAGSIFGRLLKGRMISFVCSAFVGDDSFDPHREES